MIKPEDVTDCLKPHLNKLLRAAQIALPGEQFAAYRSFVLDELGRNGFERSVRDLFTDDGKHGL